MFTKLRAKHGDVVFAHGTIVLNSQKAAMDILGTNAKVSAGRPALIMASELSGYDRFLALHQDTDRHRYGRTYLHSAIGPQRARDYAPAQEEQSLRFLRKLLEDPDGFEEHSRWVVAASILLITYGYIALDANDPYIEASNDVMKRFFRGGETREMVC